MLGYGAARSRPLSKSCNVTTTLKGRARSPVHEFMPEIILKMARVFSVVLVRQSGRNSGGDVTSARNTRVQTRG